MSVLQKPATVKRSKSDDVTQIAELRRSAPPPLQRARTASSCSYYERAAAVAFKNMDEGQIGAKESMREDKKLSWMNPLNSYGTTPAVVMDKVFAMWKDWKMLSGCQSWYKSVDARAAYPTLIELGVDRARKGGTKEALQIWDDALAIQLAMDSCPYEDVATTLNLVGVVLSDSGGEENAFVAYEALQQSLEIRQAVLGYGHQHTSDVAHNLWLHLHNTNFEAKRTRREKIMNLGRKRSQIDWGDDDKDNDKDEYLNEKEDCVRSRGNASERCTIQGEGKGSQFPQKTRLRRFTAKSA